MRKLQFILGFVFVLGTSALGQKVTGIVYYVDEPVKNAQVESSDNGNRVKTDVNGYFSVNTQNDATLKISYKGIKQDLLLNGIDGYADVVLIPKEKRFYKLIANSPSIQKCSIFLAQFPESKYQSDIKETLEEQVFISAYDRAVKNYDLALMLNYVDHYPAGKYVAKAKKTVDVISWQKAKSMDTEEAYNHYLTTFPNGEAVSLAKERMAVLSK